MAGLKLIAEPWDLGPYGYQLGNFPPGWAEWNGQYRDTVRRFWKGDKGLVAEMASRVAGSSDIFGYRGRRPWASINFITVHDGFTLQDLVSYSKKHNEANGEDNRDGTDANYQLELRRGGGERRSRRSSPCATARSATCWPPFCCRSACRCCSPAMRSGGRSAATTMPIVRTTKSPGSTGKTSGRGTRNWLGFVRYLIHLRRRHRVFSRPRFLRGEVLSEAGVKDITWTTPLGKEATTEDWKNPEGLALGYVLSGAAGEFFTPGGQRDIDESFLVIMNAHSDELDFRFPILASPMSWEALVDTAEPTGHVAEPTRYGAGEIYRLRAHSFALFIDRASRPIPRRVPVATGAVLLDGTRDPLT